MSKRILLSVLPAEIISNIILTYECDFRTYNLVGT